MTHHLVLILVLAAALQTGACPSTCDCRNYPLDRPKITEYSTSVFCDGFSANVTKELEVSTSEIAVSGLGRDELMGFLGELVREESRLPYLAQLTITRSVIPSTINLTFATIRSVNLPRNQIEGLTDSFFNVSCLVNLDLSNNSIAKIDNSPFRTLQSLEMLNLSGNGLAGINSNSFSGLAALKCLDLSDNNLSSFDNQVFAALTSLQFLNLSNNQLVILDEACFRSLVKLQQLDVSRNRLARVELGTLQLPSLARLLLAGNPKLGESREPVLLVGTGQRLQTVDASRIGLKQVPAALTHSIRTLRLGGNSITTVRCGDLDSYPLLQLLDFTANGLETVEDDALGRLDSLSILYLSYNNMTEIPRSLSEKLKVLHLERNRITKINAKDLQGLSSLEVLLINDNKISLVEEEAFAPLTALVTLDLSGNPIKILAAGSLFGPLRLEVLRLSNIAVIAPAKEVSFPLSSPEHLITLDLSRSPGLARQLLVDTAALAAARELQELDLSFTQLEFVRSDLLHFLPQLRIFHVEGNRINCTQLEWLANWMRRQDEPEYKKLTCASPPELWGTLIIDLQDITDDFAVDPDENNVDLKSAITDKPVELNSVIEIEIATRQEPPENSTTEDPEIAENATVVAAQEASDANESPESLHHNKVDKARDLFIASPPKISGEHVASNEVDSNYSREQRWNVSSGEMSMFTTGDRTRSGVLHPGMWILAAGIVGAAAALAVLAARLNGRRRRRVEEDVEVSSLPGVTELW